MKTAKTLFLLALIPVFFLACENPIGLGNKLDIDGPVVEITSPDSREIVQEGFYITGTAYDYSGVERLLIKASVDKVPFVKQWQYEGGSWQISENGGLTWAPCTGEWSGSSKSAVWSVYIDMEIGGKTEDGEYLFSVQAWDVSGFSDDNSFKTRVFIIDTDPPSVSVINPYLYSRAAVSYNESLSQYEIKDAELLKLDAIPDNDDSVSTGRKNPVYIGKFQTNEFKLQWQIEENQDIGSVDIYFFEYDEYIDNDPDTEPPINYIYKYSESNVVIKPNGTITVPALDGTGPARDGELKTPISGKTTIKIVAVCNDKAGNHNEERTLGYFIYWPAADLPWITFEGMKEPGDFSSPAGVNENTTLMMYPGNEIKALAFHAHGVKQVTFKVYKQEEGNSTAFNWGNPVSWEEIGFTNHDQGIKNNPLRGGKEDNYSTTFSWGFKPPARTGIYMIEAEAESLYGKKSGLLQAVFVVKDITFPTFMSVNPSEFDNLYMHLDSNGTTLTISGRVSDAVGVKSILMAWINPQSEGFSSMSQLAYFQDPEYDGWNQAADLANTAPGALEDPSVSTTPSPPAAPGDGYPKDPANPNRLWKLAFSQNGDNGAGRNLYDFSRTINLANELGTVTGNGIGPNTNQQPLKSQVFLLKVTNDDGKSSIRTYSPKGDVTPPQIDSLKLAVNTNNGAGDYTEIIARSDQKVPILKATDRIRITGRWEEDSLRGGKLTLADHLRSKMIFSINGANVPTTGTWAANGTITNATTGTTITVLQTGMNAKGTAVEGTFQIDATVGDNNDGRLLQASSLKDMIMVSISITDIGGNPNQESEQWPIQSEGLSFLRISSDKDGYFKVGDKIDFYLEFTKPVQLKAGVTAPRLILNATNGINDAYADFVSPQNYDNPRQYFTYTVENGFNTPPGEALDVKGLEGGDATWSANDYRFVWVHTPAAAGSDKEEIRLTTQARAPGAGYTTHILPTGKGTPAAPVVTSLIAGKEIYIDTAPITITDITATPAGYHTTGSDIYIKVEFSKPVKLQRNNLGDITNLPRLTLALADAGETEITTNNQTTNVPSDVKVSEAGGRGTIEFRYTVRDGDNSNGTGRVLRVSAISGVILDTPGAAFTDSIPANLQNITGVYIDTNPPPVPTVTVTGRTTGLANIVLNAGANGGTLYSETVTVTVANPSPTEAFAGQDRWKLEYSTVDSGTPVWNTYNDGAGSAGGVIDLSQNGSYRITARQTDRAGNQSAASAPIILNLDRGAIVTRVDSNKPNGTYTNNTARKDTIQIDMYFRKQIRFTTVPRINLNVTPEATASVSATGYTANTMTDKLSFLYTIGPTDNTPTGTRLALTNTGIDLNGGQVFDAANPGGTNISNYVILPAGGSNLLLHELKDLRVETGGLSITGSTFTTGTQNDDGSQNAVLNITFNKNIVRGTGEIRIVQQAAGYRLPAVLTTAQRDKYRSRLDSTNQGTFDSYYARGINGGTVTDGQFTADTTNKYVLDYAHDTFTLTTTNDAFVEAFRIAEEITVNAQNAQVVYVDPLGSNTLSITLNATYDNALQVPGASYDIILPAGFVQDSLSNQSPAVTEKAAITGVAKPFVRIKKVQDIIEPPVVVANRPTITATQPLETQARFDCRTPNSTVWYSFSQSATTTNARNWGVWNAGANAIGTGPADSLTVGNPTEPTPPTGAGANGGNFQSGTTPITIGAGSTIDTVQGLQWWVRARGRANNAFSAADAYDMAYRSVITYEINGGLGTGNGGTAGMTDGSTGVYLRTGEQVWIRGGDSPDSSTLPGFPLTWQDDQVRLTSEQKRSGFRLMTRIGPENNTQQISTWRWVTWEAKVTTYFLVYKGEDVTPGANPAANQTLANELWQYGPRGWNAQRAGWSPFIDRYPVYPGKHRWMFVNGNASFAGIGQANFNAGFVTRSYPTATSIPEPNQ